MSGHSKWSTIKRKKGANDAARSKVFSKLGKAISIAVKTGGGPNPESNSKLRMAVDQAKASNMPKDNIERAISRADKDATVMDEVIYEGFGPAGVGIMIETTTDNRNRTSQELKFMLDRSGGSIGSPGSVSFNFEQKGYLLVKIENAQEQMLALIDTGADDIVEGEDGIEIYTVATELYNVRHKVEELGYEVLETMLIWKPKVLTELDEKGQAQMEKLLNELSEHDDVQNVFVSTDS